MQNKKIQMWALSMSSYNSTIEYNSSSLSFVEPNDSDGDMDVNEVHLLPNSHQMKSVKSVERRKGHQEPRDMSQDKGDVKQLLRLISNML